MPQAYRHGVLMGNWNEDAFGSAIIRSDVQRGDPPQSVHLTSTTLSTPPRRLVAHVIHCTYWFALISFLFQDEHARSFSHSCYTAAGLTEAANGVLVSHIHPRCPASLSTHLLLGHTVNPTTTFTYQSEHSRAFGPRTDDRAMEKAMKAKADANRGREEEDERELRTRQRTYKTVASESYSMEHSIVASDEKRSPFLVKQGTLTMPAAVYNLQLRK